MASSGDSTRHAGPRERRLQAGLPAPHGVCGGGGRLLLFLVAEFVADLFAGAEQRGGLAFGRGVFRGLLVIGLLLGFAGLLPLLLDGGHLGVHGLLRRLFALLYVAGALAQVLLRQVQAVGGGLDGLSERKLITLEILGAAFFNLLKNGKHRLFRGGHGSESDFDVGLAQAGLIRHGIDGIEDFGVLVQRVVDEDRAAGLLLA